MKVRIIDPKDFNCGKEFEGSRVYNDYLHGKTIDGKLQDLYSVTIDGQEKQYLTHQIDEDYYLQQERASEVERLGADIGDTVLIKGTGGGGSFSGGWSHAGEHVISDISPYGYVEFDNGQASIFRPTVEKVTKEGK